MSRTVLVLGASGFIGAAVAAALAERGWRVRAGARDPVEAARRTPGLEWARADFARLTTTEAWGPLLDGVDAVVNCVGVLQDGGGDSTRIAHETGPTALIAACERGGVRRFIHLSAVGADEGAATAYARSKQAAERALAASGLDYLVLRPSLVMDRAVYGGTALMRGLAGFPVFIPVVGGDQRFRPLAMADLSSAIAAGLAPGAPSRTSLELAGPEAASLSELLTRLRGWLGLGAAPVVRVPGWAAAAALAGGDLLGRLGWPSALRTTSLRQMNHDVEGDPDGWTALGLTPLGLEAILRRAPATVQDRWHARLYFVRPIAIAVLALFWIGTGVVSLGPGREAAVGVLLTGGFGGWSPWVADIGSLFDVAMGLALLVRRWTARVATLMVAATVGYLVVGTATLPQLWLDPLGPWLKVIPMMALCLFVAATDARR